MIAGLENMKAREIAARIHDGEITCADAADYFLSRIEKANPRLNALISFNRDFAQARAERLDREIKKGRTNSPLAGVPIVIKDNINVEGMPTTCGSRMLAGYLSVYNAAVTERLLNAGLVILGKTNMDEFAMGSSSEHSYFGSVKNPHDITRVAGGSSGGSAAAVAGGLAPAALGSDTAGSIKLPASFCGLVGLRPSYGRVSRYGLVAFASSFDQIGPLTLDITDAASLLSIISGYDARDSTSVNKRAESYLQDLRQMPEIMKIGVPREYFDELIQPEVRQAIDRAIECLKHEKIKLVDISLPATKYCIAAYYILADAEASANLARYDGVRYGYRSDDANLPDDMYCNTRTIGFGPEVKRRILLGTFALSAGFYDRYYLKAFRARHMISNDINRAFEKCDLIMTPTSPTTAFPLEAKLDDPLEMYLSDIYLTAPSLAGIPSLSMPCGRDSAGLPIGLQLMARYFDEATLLKGGYFIERMLADAGI